MSCPLYNNSNLNYTGSDYNSPYGLIQKGGKRKNKSNQRYRSKF